MNTQHEIHNEPFYMVVRLGGGEPSKGHATRESAQAEAKRLCQKHPNNTFYVLEAVSMYRSKVDIQESFFKAYHEPNPFCSCNDCKRARMVVPL
jgi:hypothetical protein